ncbi:hypothetical protein B0H13DRAFT_1863725 [Mycena leptocephala]|nr:hypothetical protein B0H13DRAFT_1863725 [Mycena leptocephala]
MPLCSLSLATIKFTPAQTLHAGEYQGKRDKRYCKTTNFQLAEALSKTVARRQILLNNYTKIYFEYKERPCKKSPENQAKKKKAGARHEVEPKGCRRHEVGPVARHEVGGRPRVAVRRRVGRRPVLWSLHKREVGDGRQRTRKCLPLFGMPSSGIAFTWPEVLRRALNN